MTSGVQQAMAQLLVVKPNADRQAPNKQAGQSGFGDALRAAKSGKQPNAVTPPLDAEPHWVRLSAKFAIDKTGAFGSKLLPEMQTHDGLEDGEAVAEEGTASEESTDGAGIPFEQTPAITLPYSSLAARRIAGAADGEKRSDEFTKTGANADVDVAAAEPDASDSKLIVRVASAASDRQAAPVVPAPASQSMNPATAQATAPLADPARTSAALRDPKPIAARATIIAEQSIPAPAPTPVIGTAAALAETLVSETTRLASIEKPAAPLPAQHIIAGQAHSLKLQLHPAELGMVTASLRFAGEQLSIELQVENSEAYQRLSVDSETIVKSLRGLGYEIDRVTIVQSQVASSASPRADANPSPAGQSPRDQQSFGSQGSDGGGERLGGQQSGRDGNDSRQNGQKSAGALQDRTGDSLYI